MKRTGRPASGASSTAARRRRAKAIRLLLMDVDGVLTDGRIVLLADGSETKFFDVKDGVALHLARHAGLATGWITGRGSEAVRRRARELRIGELHERAIDKLPVYRRILADHQLTDREVCYIGDDWVDIPILRRVGLAVAPADAVAEVVRHVHWRTRASGGRGAVREVIDLILRAQGHHQTLLDRYRLDAGEEARPRRTGGKR